MVTTRSLIMKKKLYKKETEKSEGEKFTDEVVYDKIFIEKVKRDIYYSETLITYYNSKSHIKKLK